MKQQLENNGNPAVEYIIDRLKPIRKGSRAQVMVEGKITAVRTESTLLRQFGGAYTGDTIQASIDYEPEYLPCDFVIDDPDQKITKAGSSVILVKEVAQRLSSELDAIVAVTMAQHEKTLQEALNPPEEAPAEMILVHTTEVF